MLKRQSKTFVEQMGERRQSYQGTSATKEVAFDHLLDSTDMFLEFIAIKERTNEKYEPVRDAYHELTDCCPTEGPGCDDCYASSKFLEQHISIWDYIQNDAPEGSPKQGCVCSALRDLCDESLEIDKLKELRDLLVAAKNAVPEQGA